MASSASSAEPALSPVVIEVRCNEYTMRDRNPHVPWSPAEIAADAAACAAAGASIFHFHARDPETGRPATATELYGETIARTRDLTDVVLMPTLGANTLPDPADRVTHIVELSSDDATRPDLAPVDLGSFSLDVYDREAHAFRADDLLYLNTARTVRYLWDTITDAGVKPMAALWNVGSARLLGALLDCGAITEPVYSQVTLSENVLSAHPVSVAGLRALVGFLPDHDGIWSVDANGGNLLPLVGAAVELGGHPSIGLGDYAYPELGTPTNANLVEHLVGVLAGLGRRPATVAETRALLGIS
jgi:3-keto-5-aminohexanoate cleavage enzyme